MSDFDGAVRLFCSFLSKLSFRFSKNVYTDKVRSVRGRYLEKRFHFFIVSAIIVLLKGFFTIRDIRRSEVAV